MAKLDKKRHPQHMSNLNNKFLFLRHETKKKLKKKQDGVRNVTFISVLHK